MARPRWQEGWLLQRARHAPLLLPTFIYNVTTHALHPPASSSSQQPLWAAGRTISDVQAWQMHASRK